MEFCFDINPAVCATYFDTFPFWEVLATALITGVITAVVTAVTIVAATRSAREATARQLRAAGAQHRETLEQAERTARWQARNQEALLLRRTLELQKRVSETKSVVDQRAAADALYQAETAMKISLTPAAPELLTLLQFEMLRSSLRPKNKPDPLAEVLDVISSKDELVKIIEAWARDPDSLVAEIIRKAAVAKPFTDESGEKLLRDLLFAVQHPNSDVDPHPEDFETDHRALPKPSPKS